MLRLKAQKMQSLATVDDFLRNDDFIRYTLDCESDQGGRWSQYLNASPAIREAFIKASDILLHLDECSALTKEQVMQLKRRITRSLCLGS